MRKIALLMMVILMAAPADASVYKDFAKAWDARDAGYRAERPALDARAKASADRVIQSLIANDPAAGDDLEMALTASWSLSELVARGQMLGMLREHMDGKPSAAITEVWLQGKADELRRRQTEADLIARQIDMLKGRDTTSVAQWIAALEQLTMMYGTISGMASELVLIDQNLRSYYRARAEEGGLSSALLAAALVALGTAARDGQADVQRRSSHCARTGTCTDR